MICLISIESLLYCVLTHKYSTLFYRGGRSGRGRGGGGRGSGRGRGTVHQSHDRDVDYNGSDVEDHHDKRKPGRPKLTPEEKQRRKDERQIEKLVSSQTEQEVVISHQPSNMISSGYQLPYVEDKFDDNVGPEYLNLVKRPTSSTPAFFFFVLSNRHVIEKSLHRKSRLFRGLPRGYARNEQVAQEGAAIWMDLTHDEKNAWIDVSMTDFEQRVIAWKEKEAIESMVKEVEGDKSEDQATKEEATEDILDSKEPLTAEDDDAFLISSQSRLVQFSKVKSTSVKSSRNKEINNRVLLELLNDVRFQPLPLFSASRASEDLTRKRSEKLSIQQFSVQGPIETSVGDDCLGCTRGWNHYCSVLKCNIPSSELRAKLQPPVSSLAATRVGLGLKVHLPPKPSEDNPQEVSTPGVLEEKCLNYQPVDSFCLTDISLRHDDVSVFIEDAMAVKTVKLNKDGSIAGNQGKHLSRGLLPLRGRKRTPDENADGQANGEEAQRDGGRKKRRHKCKCGTISSNPCGCIPCRRSQLISEMAKHDFVSPYDVQPEFLKSTSALLESPNYGEGFVKPACVMLGRNNLIDIDVQNYGYRVRYEGIEKMLLTESWTPNAILPPQPKRLPIRNTIRGDESVDLSESGGEGDDSVSTASTNGVVSPTTKRESSAATTEGGSGNNAVTHSQSTPENASEDVRRSRRKSGEAENPQDRHALAVKHKESANELSRKCLTIACCGILSGMIRRDPSRLFAEPVSLDNVEYHRVIKEPMDFQTIREKLLASQYPTLGSFMSDTKMLCINACVFNAADSLYAKTATQIYDALMIMHKRAHQWISILKNTHASAFILNDDGDSGDEKDIFKDVKDTWPGAVELLENGDWLRKEIESDFVRTQENEIAYYGALAIKRTATAAAESLAPTPDVGGVQHPVVRRSHVEDELLRKKIDRAVSFIDGPVQLRDIPDWREKQLLKLVKRVQRGRVDARTSSKSGCARCDDIENEDETNAAISLQKRKMPPKRYVDTTKKRLADSRLPQSTGMASHNAKEKAKVDQYHANALPESIGHVANEDMVSVGGSGIHGWGLFADYPFRKDDIVAEYIGEYISDAVADVREKYYRKQRIQDYQFKVDGSLVIDATLKGGYARYINHSCNPNCIAKIVSGKAPNQHLKRVIIVAQRDIQATEELSYDYQFPLETDLDLRIPCNCGSRHCRGFMNWDIPEMATAKGQIRR